MHLSTPPVIAELKRHFTSTWALRDALAADVDAQSAVAAHLLDAFVFPVTAVVRSRSVWPVWPVWPVVA